MAYVSPNCPLPRNSSDPVTACEAARAREIVSGMEASVNDAFANSRKIASPQSFAQFGQPVVQSAVNGQNRLKQADIRSVPKVALNVRQEVANAPRVLPLNVSPDEYDSCCNRGTNALRPVQVASSKTSLVMPPSAPVLDLARADSQPSRLQTQRYALQRGMGAVWGDASSLPCGSTWGKGKALQSHSVSGGTLLLMGIAALGLFAAGRR